MSGSRSGQIESSWLWMGGLLLLILVALAVLWIRERSAGQRYRSKLAEKEAELDQQRAEFAMQAFLQENQSPVIQRSNLPAQYRQLDGAQVTVLTLSAETGQQLGFMPGDVIIVAEPLGAPDEAGRDTSVEP
jgi:hypothetical protein